MMFVVERLPDAFQRKIKQLGFSEVDCVEFRHLDVSGTPAAYFDTVARLRRGSAQAEFQPAPIARRVSEGPTRRTPEMASAERPVDHGDKVVPLSSAPGARATSVRLQKMLNTTVPHHANGVAPVIEIGARSTASMPRPDVARVETPRFEAAHVELAEPDVELASPQIDAAPVEQIDAAPVETAVAVEAIETAQTPEPEVELTVETMPTLDLEELTAETIPTDVVTGEPVAVVPDAEPSVVEPVARIALREAIAAPEPVAAAPAAADASEPRLSFAEIAKELLGKASTATESALALDDAAAASKTKAVEIALTTNAEPGAPSVVATPPATPVETKVAPVTAPKPVFTAPKPVPSIKPIAPETKPAAPTLKPIAPALKPVAPAPAIAPAPKPVVPAPKPVIAAPKPAAATPKPTVAARVAAAAKPAAAAATAKPSAPDAAAPSLPQEFEGLKFPNDGVLTRQWMEFLNQMASNK
ncbi:MAG TPA: hypothetical protein VFF44_05805 [Casimicrobiaceae bacterium]|nr:hypothetical protein [Casimicrobiaceae bacterium]